MTSDMVLNKADMAYNQAELIDPLVTQNSWPREGLITWGGDWEVASNYNSSWLPSRGSRGEHRHFFVDAFVKQVVLSMSSSCSAIIDTVRSLLYLVFSIGSALPAWIAVSEMITALCLQLKLRIQYCQEKNSSAFHFHISFAIPCKHPIHSLILPQCRWIGGSE